LVFSLAKESKRSQKRIHVQFSSFLKTTLKDTKPPWLFFRPCSYLPYSKCSTTKSRGKSSHGFCSAWTSYSTNSLSTECIKPTAELPLHLSIYTPLLFSTKYSGRAVDVLFLLLKTSIACYHASGASLLRKGMDRPMTENPVLPYYG